MLWRDSSPFWSLWQLTDWLHRRLGRLVGIPLTKLADLLFEFLCSQRNETAESIAPSLLRDYQRGGRSDIPLSLRNLPATGDKPSIEGRHKNALPPRQARHVRHE